jgi:hypothetical protein
MALQPLRKKGSDERPRISPERHLDHDASIVIAW